jgi:hypothetical protein
MRAFLLPTSEPCLSPRLVSRQGHEGIVHALHVKSIGVGSAVDNNWSIRAEYRYTDYGNVSYAFPSTSVLTGYSVSKRITDNMAAVGFSYKFNLGP